MRSKIVVVGGDELAQRLAGRDYAEVVRARVSDDFSGARIVVLGEPGERFFDDIRDRAPSAVVVIVGHSPEPVCEATLFPRARIIGVDPERMLEVVDSIVLDRKGVVTGIVRCQGEHGIEDEFVPVPIRVGTGGVEEILERAE